MSEIYREDIAGVDLSEPLSRESVGKTFATGDKLANRIGVSVRRSGKPVDLTGHAVMGYFIRPDRKTVIMEGQAVGNTAYVDVAQACLTERGTFSLAIKVSGDDVTQTLRVLDGSIILTQTDALIDPGEVIPTLDDIFAQIAAMEAAADEANAAAEYANQAASSALNTTLYLMGVAAPVIIQSASGDGIVTVSDSAERTLSGMSVYGKTTQDGTPTPEAPVPMVNVGADGAVSVMLAGKNLFQDRRTSQADYTSNGITFVTNADGTFTANGTNDTTSRSSMTLTTGSRWLYLPAGTYTVSSGLANGDGYFQVSYNDEMESAGSTPVYAYATPKTFTIDKPKYAWMAINVLSGKTVENLVFKPQIEVGAVATEYEPYQEYQTMTASTPNGLPGIPVTSDGNYIDANGQQWVCDEIGFTRKLHVKRCGEIASYNGESIPGAYLSSTGTLSNGAHVIYALETPIETPLSPEELTGSTSLTAQYPTTTAFNDAGAGMKMEYIADTKSYIDQRIAALLNA